MLTPNASATPTTCLRSGRLTSMRRDHSDVDHPPRFPGGPLSAVGTFILWRNDGPCNTDDAEVYLDAVLPLAIQVQNETGWEHWARLKTLELLPKLKEMDEDLWAHHVREASKRKGVGVDKIAKLLRIREAQLKACFPTKRQLVHRRVRHCEVDLHCIFVDTHEGHARQGLEQRRDARGARGPARPGFCDRLPSSAHRLPAAERRRADCGIQWPESARLPAEGLHRREDKSLSRSGAPGCQRISLLRDRDGDGIAEVHT